MSRALLGISDGQINSNYTFKQIDILQDQVDVVTGEINNIDIDIQNINNIVYTNPANLTLVVDGISNTFDDEVTDQIIIYGQNNNVDAFSGKSINIGTENNITNGDSTITVAHNCNTTTSNRTINIGLDQDIFESDDVISIGIDNDIENAPNNIIIGNNLGLNGTRANRIVISDTPLVGAPADVVPGSIVFGGGNTPSALPKIQFLKSDLTDLADFDFIDVYNPLDAPQPVSTNGWLRIKYKNHNIRIPIMTDDDIPP